MKTSGRVLASMLLAVASVTPVHAQQPGTGTDPHHLAPPTGSSATPPAPTGQPNAAATPMTDMCHQMMGAMMGVPMMGGAAADPKDKADLLQMRGEMMKAMGDVMMKHARRMHGTAGK